MKNTETKVADEQLWGTKELAHHLGVCPRTAIKRIKDGTLPGFRIGKLWRIRPEEARSVRGRLAPARG